ncbi:MAG: (2Fe-2S)-binding protein [Planctomycetes bacterium]|nr:(2Fe-2S)-binding protein [Planctomycetota bacterium]
MSQVKITLNGKEIEAAAGSCLIEAAKVAGCEIPYYCYHEALSIAGSCRLCAVEVGQRDEAGDVKMGAKLLMSCELTVREGMVVETESEKVILHRKENMEFLLINHPLDCPVCDQAGECQLQDYSYKFGHSTSRMVDQKLKNPKKDIGPRTLLYSDRCVMCSRCVRFVDEIAGTGELCIVNRGSRSEIDVFPGVPLDNPLQGNVVDICPVGCLLDKDFLFKQRVWLLKETKSVCPGCATGCSIRIDHNENVIHRLQPRYNPKVNDWWMCDEGRFGFKYVHDEKRITRPIVRRGLDETTPKWEDLPDLLRYRLTEGVREHGSDKVAALLSPFMACEEAWLLVQFLRDVAPDCALAMGPIPSEGDDQAFPVGAEGDAVRFRIRKEKCPNRRGIEMVLESAGGITLTYDEFVKRAASGDISAAWIVGGYSKTWVDKDLAKAVGKIDLLVAQDMFPSDLTAGAAIVLPMAACWPPRSSRRTAAIA